MTVHPTTITTTETPRSPKGVKVELAQCWAFHQYRWGEEDAGLFIIDIASPFLCMSGNVHNKEQNITKKRRRRRRRPIQLHFLIRQKWGKWLRFYLWQNKQHTASIFRRCKATPRTKEKAYKVTLFRLGFVPVIYKTHQ